MAFQPDILVTGIDEPQVALVVAAKLHLPNLEQSETQLKRYMAGMQCPVGVLITPERMWVYRDTYTAGFVDSIQRVGEYAVNALWRERPPLEASQFETFVQRQLEDLRDRSGRDLPDDLRKALREHILPAIESGEVRAAHPRPS